jgi:hypothetical protein
MRVKLPKPVALQDLELTALGACSFRRRTSRRLLIGPDQTDQCVPRRKAARQRPSVGPLPHGQATPRANCWRALPDERPLARIGQR